MKNDYAYLVIYSRPKNKRDMDLLFEPTPPSFSKWIGGWFKDLLIEDYEGEFFNSSCGFGLVIPIDNVHAHIAVELQQSDSSYGCISVLLASANIKEDEFEITDCYMA